MKRPLILGLLLCAAAPRAAAQLPGILPPLSYVRDVWYPKVFWTPTQGLTAGAYLAFVAPMRYDTWDDAPPYVAAVTLDGQASTSGSRFLSLDAFAPALWDGWRFRLTAATTRQNRQNYFGLGNATLVVDANRQGGQDLFYRARRRRDYARGEVQRRIVGDLRLLGGFHLERWTVDTLETATRLAQDVAAGLDPTLGQATSDRSVRFGLVFDSRDSESAPRRGVLLEAIHGIGEVAGEPYYRSTVSARGYLPVSERLTVTGRLAGQRTAGTPRIGTLYLFEASDQPISVLGGAQSHRALDDHRFLGEHVLLGNFDVQVTAFEVPTLIRLLVVGFVDAGRVFYGEDFRITAEDLHVGGGGGLLLHFFRSAVLGLTAGGGPDGLVIHAYTRWPY